MPVKWVFDTWSNQKDINPQWSNKLKHECIYDKRPPVTSRCFKYRHNTQTNRYQVLLNWFQPYSNVKICRLCGKKTQIFLYTCAVTVNILSKSNKNFLLKKLISVIFLTNFSPAKSIDFMLSDNQDILFLYLNAVIVTAGTFEP